MRRVEAIATSCKLVLHVPPQFRAMLFQGGDFFPSPTSLPYFAYVCKERQRDRDIRQGTTGGESWPGGPPASRRRICLAAGPPDEIAELHRAIENDAGTVLALYREPFDGRWLVPAALPIDLVEPTPYQRNLSDTHVRKLESVVSRLGRFLGPIIVVRAQKPDRGAKYWTPNGHHRLSAMRTVGEKSMTAIVVPAAAAPIIRC